MRWRHVGMGQEVGVEWKRVEFKGVFSICSSSVWSFRATERLWLLRCLVFLRLTEF